MVQSFLTQMSASSQRASASSQRCGLVSHALSSVEYMLDECGIYWCLIVTCSRKLAFHIYSTTFPLTHFRNPHISQRLTSPGCLQRPAPSWQLRPTRPTRGPPSSTMSPCQRASSPDTGSPDPSPSRCGNPPPSRTPAGPLLLLLLLLLLLPLSQLDLWVCPHPHWQDNRGSITCNSRNILIPCLAPIKESAYPASRNIWDR